MPTELHRKRRDVWHGQCSTAVGSKIDERGCSVSWSPCGCAWWTAQPFEPEQYCGASCSRRERHQLGAPGDLRVLRAAHASCAQCGAWGHAVCTVQPSQRCLETFKCGPRTSFFLGVERLRSFSPGLLALDLAWRPLNVGTTSDPPRGGASACRNVRAVDEENLSVDEEICRNPPSYHFPLEALPPGRHSPRADFRPAGTFLHGSPPGRSRWAPRSGDKGTVAVRASHSGVQGAEPWGCL
jgi:hypothetical protein